VRTDSHGIVRFERLATDEFYLVRATTVDGLLGYRGCSVVGENALYEADLKLERPVATRTRVRIRDEAGLPIAAAKLWSLEHKGTNGECYWNWSQLESLGFVVEPSNRDGELTLPALSPGRVKVRVTHPECVAGNMEKFTVGEATANAKLHAGVTTALLSKIQTRRAHRFATSRSKLPDSYCGRSAELKATLLGNSLGNRKQRRDIDGKIFEQKRSRQLAAEEPSQNDIALTLEAVHCHALLVRIDNPIFGDSHHSVIAQFVIVIPLTILWIAADDFHHQIRPIPDAVTAQVKVLLTEKQDVGLTIPLSIRYPHS
jgi:hypothetical protein